MKSPEKFNKKLNTDTATASKIQETNQELSKYLNSKGEVAAAAQVDFLIKNQDQKKPSSLTKNPVYDKLLVTNTKILAIIQKMYKDMYDEQDTSIKKIDRKSKDNNVTIVNNYISGSGDTTQESDSMWKRRLGRNTKEKNKKDPKKSPIGQKPSITGVPTSTSTPAPEKPSTTKSTSSLPDGGKDVKTSGKAGGIIKKLSKFIKPIPIIGTAVAAASALYSAVDGWDSASDITGIPEDELTNTHKLAAAGGSVVSDFTFGVVGADTIAKKALEYTQPKDKADTEDKYVKAGIISDPWVGHNEVLDWVELEKLPAYEIEKIIQIGDWAEQDKKKLWDANKRAAERESVTSEESFLTNDGARKNVQTEQVIQSTTTQQTPGGTTVPGQKSPGTGSTNSTGQSGQSQAGSSPTSGAGAQTGSGKYAKVSGAPIPNAEQSKSPIVSVEDFGPGWNVVKRVDGTIEKRIGNRNWRNNNPGNVEYGDFTKRYGAIQGDPRFAIFPSFNDGRNAKRDLIFFGKNYANLVLSQAIARYAPPTENNTASYVASVLGAVGAEKYMKDYTTAEQDTILNVMQRIEGWAVGRVELIEKGIGTSQQATKTDKDGSGVTKQASSTNSGTTTSDVTKVQNGRTNETSGDSLSTMKSSTNSSSATEAMTSKERNEKVAEQNSQTLVQQKKVSDAKQASTIAQANAQLNTNINTTSNKKQDVGQDRLLNFFN